MQDNMLHLLMGKAIPAQIAIFNFELNCRIIIFVYLLLTESVKNVLSSRVMGEIKSETPVLHFCRYYINIQSLYHYKT